MDESTAQVTPYELTTAFLESAQKNGTKLVIGTVEGIVFKDEETKKEVIGVKVDKDIIKCDKVVIAMGPWSVLAEQWFHKLKVPMEGIHR
eukprot:UN02132